MSHSFSSLSLHVSRMIERTPVRGRTRLLMLLGRLFPPFRQLPVAVDGAGTVYLDLRVASSHHLLLGSTNEVEVQKVMRSLVRPGDVVYDIGAHLGVHTTLLADLVGHAGRVHAFEPNPAVLPSLQLTGSGLSNVALHSVALSNREGDAQLFVPGDHSMASLANWTRGRAGNTSTATCTMYRLDQYRAKHHLPPPDFIKCDVEGAELLVFLGATETVDRETAPIMLFEINESATTGFGYEAVEILHWLHELGNPGYHFFKIREPESGSALPSNWNRVANVLAIPRSRMACLEGVTRQLDCLSNEFAVASHGHESIGRYDDATNGVSR